jgi:hypothetical protein
MTKAAIGSGGGRRPSLGGYVTVTGPRTGRPPPEGVHVGYPLTGLDLGKARQALLKRASR